MQEIFTAWSTELNLSSNNKQELFFASAGKGLVFALALCALLMGIYLIKTATQPTDAISAMASGDYDVAARYYEVAAVQGDQIARNSLANLYYLGLGVKQDYTRASELYFAAASAGVADAQLNLGHLFKLGLGVDSDPMRAFAWYNIADRFGNPAAEYYMRQITQEWTLSPLQINTALKKWSKLSELTEVGLQAR